MYLATRGFCCTGSAGIRSPLGQRGLGPAPRALDARHSSAGGASHASETGACGIEAGGPSVSPANSCSSARRRVLSSVDSAPQCPSGIVATAVVAAFVRAAGTEACDGLSGGRAVSAAKFGQVARSGTPAALAPSNPPTSSAMPFVLIRMLPTPTLPLQITLAYILAVDIPPARRRAGESSPLSSRLGRVSGRRAGHRRVARHEDSVPKRVGARGHSILRPGKRPLMFRFSQLTPVRILG